jgi:hypothetical protein
MSMDIDKIATGKMTDDLMEKKEPATQPAPARKSVLDDFDRGYGRGARKKYQPSGDLLRGEEGSPRFREGRPKARPVVEKVGLEVDHEMKLVRMGVGSANLLCKQARDAVGDVMEAHGLIWDGEFSLGLAKFLGDRFPSLKYLDGGGELYKVVRVEKEVGGE